MIPLSLSNKLYLRMKSFEGAINHMYLDSKGFVTIGVGHLIPTPADVDKIMLYMNSTKKIATKLEKVAEYNLIKSKSKNKWAPYYKEFTTMFMMDADIQKLYRNHVTSFYLELKSLYRNGNGYANFDSFPEEVQLALFDMVFNLGLTRLKNVFLNFNKAIKDQNWLKAAQESRRPDVQPERNQYVKSLLMTAHKRYSGKVFS